MAGTKVWIPEPLKRRQSGPGPNRRIKSHIQKGCLPSTPPIPKSLHRSPIPSLSDYLTSLVIIDNYYMYKKLGGHPRLALNCEGEVKHQQLTRGDETRNLHYMFIKCDKANPLDFRISILFVLLSLFPGSPSVRVFSHCLSHQSV